MDKHERQRLQSEIAQILRINAWIQSDQKPALLLDGDKRIESVAFDKSWMWTTEDGKIQVSNDLLTSDELMNLFRQTYTPSITHVFSFPNGIVVVTDQHGLQMPEFQGPIEQVKAKIQEHFTGKWESNDTLRNLLLGVDTSYPADDYGIVATHFLDDGRILEVQRQTYGAAQLWIRKVNDFGLQNQWQYASIERAIQSMNEWDIQKEEEPTGWIRHPDTQRYRIQGDPNLEFVKDYEGEIENKSIEQQVRYALLTIFGQDRVIQEVIDRSTQLGSSFPESTRLFSLVSTSSTCPHSPPCQWIDEVFHYLDRSVVISMSQSTRIIGGISVGTVLRRLTENI